MNQFYNYLVKNFNDERRATTDYALRVERLEDGTVKFYIHAQGDQSNILYLELYGDIVSPWLRSKIAG